MTVLMVIMQAVLATLILNGDELWMIWDDKKPKKWFVGRTVSILLGHCYTIQLLWTQHKNIFFLDYGFQPIKHKEEEGLRHEVDGDLSDWKSRITGGLDI